VRFSVEERNHRLKREWEQPTRRAISAVWLATEFIRFAFRKNYPDRVREGIALSPVLQSDSICPLVGASCPSTRLSEAVFQSVDTTHHHRQGMIAGTQLTALPLYCRDLFQSRNPGPWSCPHTLAVSFVVVQRERRDKFPSTFNSSELDECSHTMQGPNDPVFGLVAGRRFLDFSWAG